MKTGGFTMVELILVILLLGILSAVSLPMLMGGFNAFYQQRETAQIEREAMLALERIAREVRMSTNFTVGGSSIQFNRPEGDPVEISLSGNQVVLDSGSSSILARGVSSFSPEGPIEHEGACYLRVAFTTSPSLQWQQVVFLRNVSSC